MSYGRSVSDLEIEADQVAWLARLLGLELQPQEVSALSEALANQLPSLAVLERFDLRDYPPILTMDADWHE